MRGLAFVIGHLLGDFVLQNDYMAKNKRHDTLVCMLHVGIYCSVIECFTAWPWWAIAITFFCHFVQDRSRVVSMWMDWWGQKEFRTGAFAPWSVVVVDNTFHLLQMYLTQLLVDRVSNGSW